MLQLRAKSIEQKKTLELARIIKPICNDYGVPLIINDHPIIAAEVNADGVHIGQDDGTIENVRKLYKGCRIVGRSTHSISQVRRLKKREPITLALVHFMQPLQNREGPPSD